MFGLNRKSIAHILLLTLLLVAQGLVLAHEAGHELSAGSEQCWVCLHGSHFKSAAPTAAIPLAATAERPTPLLARQAVPLLRHGDILGARGPPASPAPV